MSSIITGDLTKLRDKIKAKKRSTDRDKAKIHELNWAIKLLRGIESGKFQILINEIY